MAIPDEDLQVQADAAVAQADQQAAAKQEVIDTLTIARDSMANSGDQEGALEAQRQLQGLDAPVLDIAMEPNALGQELPPTVAQRGMVTDPNQLTRTRADAQNAATMRGVNGQVPDERAPGITPQDIYAPNDTGDALPVAPRGGGQAGPITTLEHYASTQAVADGLEGLANEYEKVYGEATADILTSRGMMLEAVDAYKASNADLDPKALYEEVSKRMQENDQKVEQVRQYFMNLSGQSVNPARLYANGGAMTASLAVAVGALSQAMLGPGAPNTALNILESALERDIRAQEMTLNNARQAGQGMLQALAASQEILGDRVQAMSTTKIALREDLLARLEGAVKLTGNAVARANLAQVYAESQQKALIEKSKLDGQIVRSVTNLSAAQVRKGALAQQVQTMAQRLVDANAPQAAASTQPAAPSGGISAKDVAGKRAGGKAPGKKVVQPPAPPAAPAGLSHQSGWAPGEAPDQDADGVPNSVDPDFDPKKPETAPKAAAPATSKATAYRPAEGDKLRDASGQVVRHVVKTSTGHLAPGKPLKGREGLAAVYDDASYARLKQLRDGNSADRKTAEEIMKLPSVYQYNDSRNKEAITGIRKWIKDNPGTNGVAITVNANGVYTSPEAQKLQRYVSLLSGPAISRYKAAANMTDAVSEKERVLALGDLSAGDNQFINVEGLRMIADNAEVDNATGLRDIESRLHDFGIAIVKSKSEADVADVAGKGKLRGAQR